MKTLVLGLGNPLLRDDAVGLLVAERLKPLLANQTDVEVDLDY
jgi:Ni,Fe-hydrogenase maturation factor